MEYANPGVRIPSFGVQGRFSEFRQLIDVRAEWKRRFGRTRDCEAALVATALVIAGTRVGVVGTKGVLHIELDLCIIDEGSKATPTELLVPLSRSRSWIL